MSTFNRIMSLRDMLDLPTADLFLALGEVNFIRGTLAESHELVASGKAKVIVSTKVGTDLLRLAECLITEAERLRFYAAFQGAKRLRGLLRSDRLVWGVEATPIFYLTIISAIDQVVGPAYDELSGTKFFSLFPDEVGFYLPEAPLFGQEVDKAFPSMQYDIEEAGKCMAFSRWTAAVMHLMRALEIPLNALENAVDVEKQKDNWHAKLDQIEAKIRQITKHNSAIGDEAWFAEAAASFRYIKNAWRNYAAHGKDKYDQERAMNIFNACKALSRHLASRITEL